MTKSIILLEGKNDALSFKEKYNFDDYKVICFDYYSHEVLKNENITHELIEDYFNDNDEEKIDDNVIRIITHWYNQDFNKGVFRYNEANLGFCVELDLLELILTANKRIVGIGKILEKYNPKKIICGTLIKYLNEFSMKGVTIISEPILLNLATDKINIPIDIFGKNLNININRKKFLKIKRIVEKITNTIVNTKFEEKLIKNRKNILLLDFNIIQYFDLIENLGNEFDNVVLLNQRKPVIWNLKSLKYFKRTQSMILNLEDFQNSLMGKINIDKINFHKKISENFKNNGFKEYFSYEKQSFWNAIENEFKEFIFTRATDLIWRYNIIHKILEENKIECILEWAHTGFEEKIVISIANKMNIQIVFLQHALSQHNEKFIKYRPFIPVLPSQNSKQVVWGKYMEKLLNENNQNMNSITIGSPKHDIFFNTKKCQSENKNILIAISDFLPFTISGNDTRDYIKFEESIKKVIEYFKEHPKLNPIIKVHPALSYFDIIKKIKEFDSKITILKSGDTIELVKNCDVLISLNYSTILLEGMIFDKPTMCLTVQRQNIVNEPSVKTNSTLFVDEISHIEKSLDKLIFDENTKKELISNGRKFVDCYLSNHGVASKTLANFLKNH